MRIVYRGIGDHLARNNLEELYRHRFGALVRGVTAVVGDGELALDVVQEAFAKAVRQRRRLFRGESDLEDLRGASSWISIATVSARACASGVRWSYRRPTVTQRSWNPTIRSALSYRSARTATF